MSNSEYYAYDDNISACDVMSQHSGEGQYSIIRNEVRATWPKRRPKLEYQMPKENALNESRLTVLQASNSRCHSPLNGSVSDLICKDVDENITDLQNNLSELTYKLEKANNERLEKTNQYKRNAEENKILHSKIKSLENHYSEMEMNFRDELEKIRQAHTVDMKKLTTFKNERINEIRNKNSKYEKDLTSQRITGIARKNELSSLHYEVQRLQEKISSSQHQAAVLQEEYNRLEEIVQREYNIEKKERDVAESKVSTLEEEITDAKQPKGLSRLLPTARDQFDSLYRVSQRLNQDNRKLREELEEAQAEMLAQSLAEGRSLLEKNELSWASETDSHTKSELIDYIIREKEANYRLRQYSDKLISKVIEVDSSILEI